MAHCLHHFILLCCFLSANDLDRRDVRASPYPERPRAVMQGVAGIFAPSGRPRPLFDWQALWDCS